MMLQVATSQHFSLLMISLIFITSITTPLVKFLYNPIVWYNTTKRRSIQHLKPNYPLRLLACLHTEDQAPPLLDLLEVSYPSPNSPLMLYLLHLTPITGGLSAILRPYRNPKKANANPTASDRIVNAFRYIEDNHPSNSISLSPFIASSPLPSMHNDVCSLALDKKIRLILLPFHKHSDGARETARSALQNLNKHVLDFAPCSVAIVVDRSVVGGGVATAAVPCVRTNHLLQRAVVYFLGGADDREALSLAMRMAAGGVALTVVRFRLRGGGEKVDEEDDELIGEVRLKYGEVEGVVYIEKVVADGEGTVAVVRDMSQKYDLVIVGRRKGVVETGLTEGLSAWSECPELGVLGDLLAGTELGGRVTILVVQQQEMVGSGRKKEEVVNKECKSGLLGDADQ